MPKKQSDSKPNPFADLYKKETAIQPQAEQEGQPTADKKVASLQANRQGKKAINAYLNTAAFREFKLLVADTGRTQQDLLIEAINDLLIKHGKKGLA